MEQFVRWPGYHHLPSNGIEFERYVATLVQDLGFLVYVTSESNDFGADIVASDAAGERRVCIQAKFYGSTLDNSPIQEVVASLAHYHANEAWVVTNSSFTDNAIQLAKDNHVRLIENRILNRLIDAVVSGNTDRLPDFYKGTKQVESKEPTHKSATHRNSYYFDPLIWEAAHFVVESGLGSTSSLQRRLKMGYARAARIMDMLEELGVVGPPDGSKPREVFLDKDGLARLERIELGEEEDSVDDSSSHSDSGKDASSQTDVEREDGSSGLSSAKPAPSLAWVDSITWEAAHLVVTSKQASSSFLRHNLHVGLFEASRILDVLEVLGVVGPSAGFKSRKVLLDGKGLAELERRRD